MRLLGYIRVSAVKGRAGETFISPGVQREKIDGYARLHDHTLIATLEELDESGSSMDRPLLQQALATIEAGGADGIVVAKLDRFGRTLVGALDAVRRIEQAGGQLVSVDDQFDTSTPMGRFALQIMLALAELEHARIRDNWRIARKRAVDRGIHITPRIPVGYQRRHDGRLEADPDVAPLISEAFRQRANGVPLAAIADDLNTAGVRTSYGGEWISETVRRLFTNRVYLGEAAGQLTVDAGGAHAHEPLVTPDIFDRAIAHRRAPSARTGSGSLLAGLIRCTGCRYVMTRAGGTRAPRYRCRGRQTVGDCPAPAAVHPHVIEEYVVEQFLAAIADDSPILEVAAANIAIDPLRAAVDRADAELAAWRDDQELVALGRDIYMDGLQTRLRRRDHARQLLQQALAELDAADAFDHAITLRDEFPALHVDDQRALLASVIDVVFLSRGRIPISQRTTILWRGQGPTDLPRRSKPKPITSFRLERHAHHAAGMPTPTDLLIARTQSVPGIL